MADAREELLDSIEMLPDDVKKHVERMLEPVSDKAYVHTWAGTGTLAPRILFYPAGHESRRLKNEEAYKDMGDVVFFLGQLASLGIRLTRNQDATITLKAKAGGTLAHLKPCCPRCHTILPDKWFNSVGYHKISLLAPPLGGKTTLLASWMIQNYQAIHTMGFSSGNFSAVYGFTKGDTEFEIQKYFRQAADELFRTGKYPDRDESARKPPLFTRIIHYTDQVKPETGKKEEYLLVGTYDIAGETLKGIQSGAISSELTAYLNHMDSYIYLISPSRMTGLSRVITDEKASVVQEEVSHVLSLEEQAEYQKNHRTQVNASALLASQGRKEDPWEIFHQVDTLLMDEGIKTRAHMAYTIVKCDQIMDLPEIADTADVEILFSNPAGSRVMDERYVVQNSLEVKKIVSRFAVPGTQQQKKDFMAYLSNDDPDRGGFRSVSWHCVSANSNEDKQGTYQSIRRTDPLVGCLSAEFKRLGWS
jgi:hypothetical protein